ncbi:MAG: cytochrome c biosis protein CcmG, thiol:disulfide interchange protein DsbE [Solirubrobacterales bacterium]|jgi:thiol-disulfide isomerase/thioredoxin|nr:cytochrome c biosis protein CcmG, thiol:disulfide interchange protein DsbE [Solirubrobacterales bacterium]
MVRTALQISTALACLMLALGVAACGGAGGGDYGGKPPDYARALAGSPPKLAALHRQGNRLLGGGVPAFERQIADLRGHPVVVNKWASWCGPCRAEFPFFQRLSARLGKRVAFLGVDANDSAAEATTFLREYPVPYPSFSDPDQKIAASFRATLGFPSTAYYDRAGKLAFTHVGAYADEAALAADVARYAR